MTTSTLLWNTSFKLVLSLALPVLAAHLIEAIIPFLILLLLLHWGKMAAAGLVSIGKTKHTFLKFFKSFPLF